MYEFLLTVHLLAAMIWVGGAAALHVLAMRFAPEHRGIAVPQFEFYGNKVIGPTSMVLLLAGFGLVAELDLSFTEPFVLIGIAGWLASSYLGFAVIGRTGRQIEAEMASASPDLARAETLYQRLLMVSRVDLLLVILVVIAMVTKPGT